QQDLQMGHMPTDKLMDGLLVLVGGIVLLTDILGLALLFPLTRTIFKQWLKERFTTMAQNQENSFFIR
ncbi:MAG: FxsA family protein, partial [Candidatus Marinimicrobia bacterium]|nr:FxsA family protein [Candidatus Neomarinimicrobiota bacterium]